ncbi:hypothetical protein [Pseudomonas sp. 18173]|uniref:hypothetical protein n=1 Tax=Pseudomonas sp. 18173 TaxID=3390055 RepID=UPI003D1E84A7
MSATPVSSLAQLEYGLDTSLGRISKSAECRIGLEQVENDAFCFALRIPPPLPEDLEQARTLVLRVEGRRLQGTVRYSERLEDGSLRLEVEPD